MKWSEISIHTTHEATEAVANILHEAGASGVVIEDSVEPDRIHEDRFGEIYALDKNDFPADGVIVKAYLPVNSFLIETMKDIEQSIEGLAEFGIDVGENAFKQMKSMKKIGQLPGKNTIILLKFLAVLRLFRRGKNMNPSIQMN